MLISNLLIFGILITYDFTNSSFPSILLLKIEKISKIILASRLSLNISGKVLTSNV